MKDDAVFLVQGADEVSHLGAEYTFHRPFIRRYDVNFDVPGAKGRRDLEANEAGAQHHGASRGPGALDDRPAIGE